MGLNFIGGERIQRGKGIGGLLRAASKLFSPITKLTKKALKSHSWKKNIKCCKR